jgi:Zn-dependent protease
MTDQDIWRPFKELSPEEQRAFLERVGEPQRDYEPIHPGSGTDWRGIFRKIWAPLAAVIGVAIKFGFVFLKFFGIFVSVAAYALIWGWRFGVGFVILILVHEMGHFIVARAQGLDVTLPTFIPFVGAYVLIKNQSQDPLRNSIVALAGPAVGALGAAAFWLAAGVKDSNLLYALAYAGFLLNLFNLIPIGFLDGGAVARAFKTARRAHSRDAAWIAVLYVGLVLLLIAGMAATHVPQSRI